jgi:hypothetical protein
MRTTVDLPDDLHRILSSLSRDRGQSLSRTVSELLRSTLTRTSPTATTEGRLTRDTSTGLPSLVLGHVTTMDDVRSLEDDW